ncbi:hypothetical protein, partial [Acidithiobacillus thiooxidans]|uniref:hypothetical protein n=1 Tax=Acidithiobacillus thiooxidans TaxID=930 RepID=UPI001C07B00D
MQSILLRITWAHVPIALQVYGHCDRPAREKKSRRRQSFPTITARARLAIASAHEKKTALYKPQYRLTGFSIAMN